MFFLKSFSTIFHVVTVTFCRKNVLLPPQFRKVRRQKPRSSLFSFFLPHHYLKLHSCLSQNSFIFCWFHQSHLNGKREKHRHFETNNAFPCPIGEKLSTHIFLNRFLVFGKQTYTRETAAIVFEIFRSITLQENTWTTRNKDTTQIYTDDEHLLALASLTIFSTTSD